MKRIEMLTDVKHDGSYFKGEVRAVSAETAGYFCGLGWARDVSGEITTAAPAVADTTLVVQNGQHVHAGATP